MFDQLVIGGFWIGAISTIISLNVMFFTMEVEEFTLEAPTCLMWGLAGFMVVILSPLIASALALFLMGTIPALILKKSLRVKAMIVISARHRMNKYIAEYEEGISPHKY